MRTVLLAALMGACGAPVEAPRVDAYDKLQGRALGTSWTVAWRTMDGVSDEAVQAVVVDALHAVDAGMSTWRDDSELAAVRAADGPVVVSEETAMVVREALELARATGGAFDPTVQPLVELWGFHGAPRTTWPTETELGAAMASVGFEHVTLARDEADRPTVDAGGAALDLSAIAKGHAVDRVANGLSGLGITDLLVEVGGEVRVAGRSPRGGPWVLAIDAPEAGETPGSVSAATVALTNGALATSGNYRTSYEVEGREVHHTLDPRTGLPATARVLSASVVAPDCRTADGWATALMVLGPDEGMPLVEARPDLEAWILVADDTGRRVVASPGMQAPRVTPLAVEGEGSRD